MTTPTVTMVPNPYKAALRSARSRSVDDAAALRGALRAAEQAMTAGAWISTTATAFGHDLAGHVTEVQRAADGALAEFDEELRSQPDSVASGAWQVHWRSVR